MKQKKIVQIDIDIKRVVSWISPLIFSEFAEYVRRFFFFPSISSIRGADTSIVNTRFK